MSHIFDALAGDKLTIYARRFGVQRRWFGLEPDAFLRARLVLELSRIFSPGLRIAERDYGPGRWIRAGDLISAYDCKVCRRPLKLREVERGACSLCTD